MEREISLSDGRVIRTVGRSILFSILVFMRIEHEVRGAAEGSQPGSIKAILPRSAEETDKAIARVETLSGVVRAKLAAAGNGENTDSETATADELTERRQLLQQWLAALDQEGRYLQHLKEVRELNQERNLEQESWHGFREAPTLLAGEQLTDAVSAQRLELRSARMMLSIFENEIARYGKNLEENRRRFRLAQEDGLQTPRQEWLVRLAMSRKDADEAAVETSEIGRQLIWEALSGQEKHLEFLERKLAEARTRTRITKADLEGMFAEINAKRSGLQLELEEAIGNDRALQTAREAAREKFHAAQTKKEISRPTADLEQLRGAAEIAQARAETSRQKVEILRGFLQLTDYIQSVWQDRFWATEPRSVRQFRGKKLHYQSYLEKLHEWKALMEDTLASVSDQMLRHGLRATDPRVAPVERELAAQLRETLQERAVVALRAVGALTMTEDLTTRMHSELSEQIERISIIGKVRFVAGEAGAFLLRIWNTDLYIAEDSVIAGGQKVSVPRSITIGKVLIALTIFLGGLLLARSAYGLVTRLSAKLGKQSRQGAAIHAKTTAAVIALISLLVAMSSVRIPWSVFAFMGGALAIGVGFGAQTLVNNFISGLILLGERTIRVGDIVEVDDQRGKVMRMGFRHSLIARGDGIEVLVPNSQFLEKKLVNWTLTDDLVRYSLSVGVAHGESPVEVSRLLGQALAEHASIARTPAPEVFFEEFGEKSLVFTLKFWMQLRHGVDGGRVRSDLRHRINALFREAGIAMLPPAGALHLDSARPLEIKIVSPPAARGDDGDRLNGRLSFQKREEVYR